MHKLSAQHIHLLLAAAFVACAETKEPVDQPIELGGTVEMNELSDTRIAGTYVRAGETLEFDARELEQSLIAVTVKLHGLTIDATLDTRDGNRMWSQDAFATSTGGDSVIAEDDVAMILAFVKAIEAEQIGISQGGGLGFHFGVLLNLWAEWVPAMDPTRIKFEDRDRAVDMCWWASAADRYHDYDGHDCSTCNGDPRQGQGRTNCSAYVAYGPWYGSACTWFWSSSTGWRCGESLMGHGNLSYQTGICYGRYGIGCGFPGGTAYFQENASHDNCVRNGHVDGSWWCSDELWNTTSPYNCW